MKLYHFPQACSRVTMTALEEIGIPYEDQVVNILKHEQKSPEYLKVHRSGKVPALAVDGQIITENPSIIFYLHITNPDAGLFPKADTELANSHYISDLSWCSSTVHPTMRQIRMPIRFTDGDTSGIEAKGHELLTDIAAHVNTRLDGGWWYGDTWSILDVYLTWLFSTGAKSGFDLDPYPHLTNVINQVEQRDSFQRALAREAQALAAAGIKPPGG